jgi:hypothetical protein
VKSVLVDTSTIDWQPGSPIYGKDSIYQGKELVQIKVLNDRRKEGGGMAYLAKFQAPPGKLIKMVAVARSEESVLCLEGGSSNKAGELIGYPGEFGCNPAGKPHSAFIGESGEVDFIVYAGEPDEIKWIGVVDIEPPE